ncbi:transcriptional protein SWT1 [Armigeres subalbatus]|uniref:transcriptional protein SWT1 n=1 Tax=Armigeres subalbatus TaxID=124917 RepID=UPI002ED55F93
MSTDEVVASVKKEQPQKDNNSPDDDNQLPKHWTKVPSKKHPGKFYFFNVATKESLWEHPGKTRALEKEKDIIRNVPGKTESKEKVQSSSAVKSEKVIQLKNDTQFKQRKNMAKERLDKLQKQLEVERKIERQKGECRKEAKTPESPRKTIASKSPTKSKEVTNSKSKRREVTCSDLSPTKKSKSDKISSKSKAIAKKTPPKATNIRLNKNENIKQEVLKSTNDVETPLKVNKELKSFKIPKKAKTEPVESSIFVETKKVDGTRPKETLSLNATVPQEKPVSKDSSIGCSNKIQKLVQKPIQVEQQQCSAKLLKLSHEPTTTETVDSIIISPKLVAQKLPEQVLPSPLLKVLSNERPSFTSTPKVQTLIQIEPSTPSLVKSPANERLAGIREKLAQEVVQQSVLLDEDAEMTDLSDAHQNVSIAVLATDSEAMDWEDIPEEVALREVVAVRQLSNPNSREAILDTSIPEYGVHLFDQIHFPRFVFLVMDTNVFLSHLKGVEQLLGKGFPHIGQPILVVPYIVLQELDRIKHREQGKPLSQAASQSIRFLNDHLKRRDPRVKGQSTIEATIHLVPVENPDDHIINCCFQLRQIIAGRARTELMLLSNDVNLRNKALVNGLPAFGYGELMAEADRIRFATDDLPHEDGAR